MLRRVVMLLAMLFAVPATAQTMKSLAHQPPDGSLITFQLTDGTVLVQGNGESDWYKLTPDINGSYINGVWSKMASLPSGYAPLYFASAVLPDGRLAISGGEYNDNNFAFTNLGAIYDPVANSWQALGHPKGWGFIGDSPSAVLADGRFVVGEKMKKNMAYLDPATLKWKDLPSQGKQDENAEEGWTLMPDGSVLTFDVKGFPNSERYLPDEGKWVTAGSTVAVLRGPQNCCGRCIQYGPKNKCYDPPGEVGRAILRPDGTIVAAGATPDGESTAHTSVYTPPSKKNPAGSWTPGPDFPNGDQASDSYAALLPSGNVLIEGSSGSLYEFDGKKLTREPANGAGGSLMVLPTGEILVGGGQVYQAAGTYKPEWAPTINAFPSSVTRGSSYQISGTQFNGMSQAAAFGDEDETQTNYPLVRITNTSTGHVFYARTHDHSSMGVATGSATITTNFDVSSATEKGASMLVVVANGIPSTPVSVTVK